MAEMADASDLGSGFFGSGGSTPSMGIWRVGRTAIALVLKTSVPWTSGFESQALRDARVAKW